MAQLSSIRKSILDLPTDEVMSIHRQLRESRMIIKKPRTAAKAKRRKEKSATLDLFSKMTDMELDELIRLRGIEL